MGQHLCFAGLLQVFFMSCSFCFNWEHFALLLGYAWGVLSFPMHHKLCLSFIPDGVRHAHKVRRRLGRYPSRSPSRSPRGSASLFCGLVAGFLHELFFLLKLEAFRITVGPSWGVLSFPMHYTLCSSFIPDGIRRAHKVPRRPGRSPSRSPSRSPHGWASWLCGFSSWARRLNWEHFTLMFGFVWGALLFLMHRTLSLPFIPGGIRRAKMVPRPPSKSPPPWWASLLCRLVSGFLCDLAA